MFSQMFTATGPLFEPNPSQKMRKVINDVFKGAGKTQLDIYRGMTPVDTGKLQQGWKQRLIAGQQPQLELYNDVNYAQYVFGRINLLGRSEGQLAELVADRMNRAIAKEFN